MESGSNPCSELHRHPLRCPPGPGPMTARSGGASGGRGDVVGERFGRPPPPPPGRETDAIETERGSRANGAATDGALSNLEPLELFGGGGNVSTTDTPAASSSSRTAKGRDDGTVSYGDHSNVEDNMRNCGSDDADGG